MTDADLSGFMETYRSLQGVLVHARLSPDEARDQASAYFHALRKYPLRDLRTAAESLLSTATKFPKPAEWIAALPKRAVADLRTMSVTDARELHRAMYGAVPWQADPCSCEDCQRAGVTHRYLRYVPTLDDARQPERAIDPLTGREETAGHWAHGFELARWYAGRDRYLEQLHARFGPRASLTTMAAALSQVHQIPAEKGEWVRKERQ